MRPILSTVSAIQVAVLYAAAAALAALPAITFYDVLVRYVFHTPTIWATEISIYLLQFLVFMTPGAMLLDGNHLRVTFWIESRIGLTRRVTECIAALTILPYAGVLTWFGAAYTIRAFERGMLSPTLLQVPLWMVYVIVPAGGALLVLAVAQRCYGIICSEHGSEATR